MLGINVIVDLVVQSVVLQLIVSSRYKLRTLMFKEISWNIVMFLLYNTHADHWSFAHHNYRIHSFRAVGMLYWMPRSSHNFFGMIFALVHVLVKLSHAYLIRWIYEPYFDWTEQCVSLNHVNHIPGISCANTSRNHSLAGGCIDIKKKH